MAQPEPIQAIALNAINTLVVQNLVKDSSGRFQTITLHRRKPLPLRGRRTFDPDARPDGPPARRPSTLPPPGDLELRLSAEDILGDGRCGTVFATQLLDLTDPLHPARLLSLRDTHLPYVPELVIKVAQPESVNELRHEAAVYEEMEVLQGASVARCYGLFEADLGPAWMFSSSPASDSGMEEFGINRNDSQAVHISILLMERVGGLLPLKEKITDKADIWAVFNDLAQLGLVQPDMRYSNLLFAPSGDGVFDGAVCPFHGRKHNYRVIDFDSTCKIDWTMKQHHFEQLGTLGRLLEMMEWGVVLEPWEY